jgi:hypothetical protein
MGNPFQNPEIRTTVSKMYDIPFTFTFDTTTPQSATQIIYAPTDCELFIVDSIICSAYDNTVAYSDTTASRPLILLQIQNKSTSDFFFDSPMDIFSMNRYSNVRSFDNMQFQPKAQIAVTVNLTNANSVVPTAPLTVQVVLFGTKHNKIIN